MKVFDRFLLCQTIDHLLQAIKLNKNFHDHGNIHKL
jgi:hypothetical protein